MSEHELISNLHNTLKGLAASPYPFVAGPESIKKRASVALIVRFQPSYSYWPESNLSPAKDLDSFFAQEWVKHGDPEILFIKRAARKGDRWTSHVALPGGRRDPEDADDQAAAIRETIEEVGIDLSPGNAIPVGNLPQRVVTTSWGKVPLMVLCPYVFVITNPFLAPLRLQPTEVASTHWVPLRALLSPDNRTSSYEDVSNRLANQETGVKRWMLRLLLGKMEFAAIRLLPSESLHCTASPAENEDATKQQSYALSSVATKVWDSLRGQQPPPAPQTQPLLLWGLTLGVLADFLDMLPPNNALQLWTYPTFTPWDVRFAIWAMTYNFKQQKLLQITNAPAESEQRDPSPAVAAVEEGLDAVEPPKKMHGSRYLSRSRSAMDESMVLVEEEEEKENASDVGLPGLGSGRGNVSRRNVSSAVGTLLEGYYDLLRKAVGVALVGRTSVLAMLFVLLAVRARRRGGQRVVKVG